MPRCAFIQIYKNNVEEKTVFEWYVEKNIPF